MIQSKKMLFGGRFTKVFCMPPHTGMELYFRQGDKLPFFNGPIFFSLRKPNLFKSTVTVNPLNVQGFLVYQEASN